MGKKKKDKKPKEKHASKIEERAKEAMKIEPPEQNPYKLDNEKRIGMFLRYGMKGKPREQTIREKRRFKK